MCHYVPIKYTFQSCWCLSGGLSVFVSSPFIAFFCFHFQTLYTYPENFRAYKVLAAANYSGFDLSVDSSFQYGTTNKTAEFLAKFPLGKVLLLGR